MAESCEVNVQTVGHVGKGNAFTRYELDKDYNGLVLHVPSLISHRNATRQRIRLCGCKIRLQRDGECRTHSFHLTSLESSPEQKPSEGLPEHAMLKNRYKDVVSTFCGVHSYEDVLLHLGDLPKGDQVILDCEFLVHFCPAGDVAAGSSPPLYRIQNKLPAKHLSYSLNFASPLGVEQVYPLFTDQPESGFKWSYLNELDKNIVHIEYEHHGNSIHPSPFSSGIAVKLSPGVSAACCTSYASRNGMLPTTPKTPWDGVLMLDNTFSRDQLPVHLQQRHLFPSEFVFVIDCSGSMSGTNIQSAADTLITCVKSLPIGCYFNVIAFGSTFRQLFHTSEKYSKKSVERAVQFSNQLQASLGGTELLAPLKWIFTRQRTSGLSCQVFIITDGGVTNTQAVLHTVRKNSHRARLVNEWGGESIITYCIPIGEPRGEGSVHGQIFGVLFTQVVLYHKPCSHIILADNHTGFLVCGRTSLQM